MASRERLVAGLPFTFTAAQARQEGLGPRDLADLQRAGGIYTLSRGVYRRGDAPATAHADLLAVCARAPKAVFCGETALALHELIDDIPSVVHIAVPRGTTRPSIDDPPVVVSQYAVATFNLDVERFEASVGEFVPVYGPARSVVDAMRHRNQLGDALALSALGRFLRSGRRGGAVELQRIARELNALAIIRPAVEAVLA